jgi:hypothetical protein
MPKISSAATAWSLQGSPVFAGHDILRVLVAVVLFCRRGGLCVAEGISCDSCRCQGFRCSQPGHYSIFSLHHDEMARNSAFTVL